MTVIQQNITTHFNFPVYFTQNLFEHENKIFVNTVCSEEKEMQHRVLFVIDHNVAKAHPQLIPSLKSYADFHSRHILLAAEPVIVTGGEEVKNDMSHVWDIVDKVNQFGIDRHSFIAIIGGGAVLDMASFAAAISHRSVRAIRIPTTVLSQDDSGVGVKNGVNMFGKKNFVGTFQTPFAVINDINFIPTLDHRDKIAGVAEAVKVAAIRDREFFQYLETNQEKISEGNLDSLAYLIQRCAKLHMHHIGNSGDPFELGSARPLDFGHWCAHKLETLSHNRVRHGEAVAVGIALDSIYSWKVGHLTEEKALRVIRLLQELGLPLWEEELLLKGDTGTYMVLEGLREFREHLGGDLHITLLRDIGDGFEVNEMNEDLVIESIHWLQNLKRNSNAA